MFPAVGELEPTPLPREPELARAAIAFEYRMLFFLLHSFGCRVAWLSKLHDRKERPQLDTWVADLGFRASRVLQGFAVFPAVGKLEPTPLPRKARASDKSQCDAARRRITVALAAE